MATTAWMLFAAETTSASWLDARALGIALWIGLAVLTVALVVLMRTRWGQVQPVSKCVVLSVFAHLLLFMYAAGTRLFVAPPAPGREAAIELAYVETTPDRQPAPTAAELKPWEAIPAEQPLLPGAAPQPQRAAADNEAVTRTTAENGWELEPAVLPQDPADVVEPERPEVDRPPPPETRPTRSFVQPAAITTPIPAEKKQADEPPTPAAPTPVHPLRTAMEPVAVEPMQPLTDRTQPNLPSELVDVGSRMQQLADVTTRAENADALAGPRDQLAESTNQDAAAVDSSGIATLRQPPPEEQPDSLVALPALPATRPTTAPDTSTVWEGVLQRTPRRLADGQPIPTPYRARSAPQRSVVAARLGATRATEAAVDAALAWLAAHQEPDGRWDPDRWGAGLEKQIAGHDRGGAGANADTGITGLAVLAFLANGQTHLEGKFRKQVQHGLEFLLRSQATDGNLSGQSRLFAAMYCHGMAALALSEAYAMTGDIRIQPYVERAVQYTVAAQHPVSGGWRYQPADLGDMSQFGWQVMALKSAALAGIEIPSETRSGMMHFMSRCAHGRHDGLACYQPGRPPSRAMTAESLACRYFLDMPPDEALLEEATQFLLGELPQAGRPNLYYWYYGTLALFQVQGEPWRQWNEALQRQLVRQQRAEGPHAGSWDPETVWGSYGGRVYSTAMAALCLQVYYRYLPLAAAGSPR